LWNSWESLILKFSCKLLFLPPPKSQSLPRIRLYRHKIPNNIYRRATFSSSNQPMTSPWPRTHSPMLQCCLTRSYSCYLSQCNRPFQNWFAKQYTPKNQHRRSPHRPLTSPSKTISWFLRCSDLICFDLVRQTFWGWLALPFMAIYSGECYLLIMSCQQMAEFLHWPFDVHWTKLCLPPNLANDQWRVEAALWPDNLWMLYPFRLHTCQWMDGNETEHNNPLLMGGDWERKCGHSEVQRQSYWEEINRFVTIRICDELEAEIDTKTLSLLTRTSQSLWWMLRRVLYTWYSTLPMVELWCSNPPNCHTNSFKRNKLRKLSHHWSCINQSSTTIDLSLFDRCIA
jgi:hypothetical protein